MGFIIHLILAGRDLLLQRQSLPAVTTEEFGRALDEALLLFPNDRLHQEAQAMADLAGGHVNLVFDGIITAKPMAQQGRVRLLAFGGKQRSPVIADVPTFAEQGLRDYDAYSWNCLFAPAKTPEADIARLNQALNAALALPAMKERLALGGSDNLGPSTPEQADAFGRTERARWVPFVRSMKLDVQ